MSDLLVLMLSVMLFVMALFCFKRHLTLKKDRSIGGAEPDKKSKLTELLDAFLP